MIEANNLDLLFESIDSGDVEKIEEILRSNTMLINDSNQVVINISSSECIFSNLIR
jgi:hypothetical protein